MLLSVVCDRESRPAYPEDPSVQRNGLSTGLWELMSQAWAHHPELRPLASDILTQMARHAAMLAPGSDSEDDQEAAPQGGGTTDVGQDIPAIWADRNVSCHHAPPVLLSD